MITRRMDALIKENEDLRQKIRNIDSTIRTLQTERRNIQSKVTENMASLFGVCSHQWVVMPPQYQENTTWRCSVCANYK